MQFTPRQHRLQHIGGVHRAFRRTGAHHSMQLVNKTMISPADSAISFENGLQPLLKLTAIFGSRHHAAQVERDQLRFFSPPARHRARSAQPTLGDGGLAHARLANQHRIILGAAQQNLYNAPYFVVAPDHRVELVLARQFGQVAPVRSQERRTYLRDWDRLLAGCPVSD